MRCVGASSLRRASQPLAASPQQPSDRPALEYISSIGGEISTLEFNGSLATDIQVAGDLVYVTDQTGGLQILRIRESGILSVVQS